MAKELVPRSYQAHIVKQCENQNSIIFLPTGSGKTFIVIQIIKRLQKNIQAAYSSGGQRTFFLVNSVVLVEQQTKVIRTLTSLSVGGYSGNDKVDLWKMKDWERELDKSQVLVMTAQILADMLAHNYIRLERINLLVFDECHQAVDRHPMRKIMMQFQHAGTHQPKVIGLTATLLNRNLKSPSVPEAIRELEKTLNAKICTTDLDHLPEVFSFSTNPREYVIGHEAHQLTPVEHEVLVVLQHLEDVVTALPVATAFCVEEHQRGYGTQMKTSKCKVKKFVSTLVRSISKNVEELGSYGAFLSMTAYLVACERMHLAAGDTDQRRVLRLATSSLTQARAMLEHAMDPLQGFQRIATHSSPKVQRLLRLLAEYSPHLETRCEYNCEGEQLSGLIFVTERISCKVLCCLLRHAAAASSTLAFLRPDFVVGYNQNPFADTREALYETKQNKAVLVKFASNQLNLLVSTEVTEEGLDIPRCSLVVRFDRVQNIRSYIQSKGRGRHEKAVFVMFVPTNDLPQFHLLYAEFRKIEKQLFSTLITQEEMRTAPSTEEMAEKYRQLYPPYIHKNASVTMDSAISLLNRYCSSLPQDKFTMLQPLYFWQMVSSPQSPRLAPPAFRVNILLPCSSPCKEPIEGLPMKCLKTAKMAAALKACEALHRAGELNNNLLPRDRFCKDLEPELMKLFFSHWMPELADVKDDVKLGTKKNKRKYPQLLPQCLRGDPSAVSFPRRYWLHRLRLEVQHEDVEAGALYDLLEGPAGFCLLTQHQLPALCPFTLYTSCGALTVHILRNQETVLSEQQFQDIKHFHCLIFSQVLDIRKSFMAYDKASGDTCYLVAPCRSGAVDWDTMREHRHLGPVPVDPSPSARRNTSLDPQYWLGAVVEPWYREGRECRYIVTKVCEYLSPDSAFCDMEDTTYRNYFHSKYNLQLLGDPQQPLLQVRYLSNKMNALLPRAVTLAGAGLSAARYLHSLEGQPARDEHLVPEFCRRYSFPGALWLQATLLPALLHRMTMLLQAEELRTTIAREVGIGCERLAQGLSWPPLVKDDHTVNKSQCTEAGKGKPVQAEEPDAEGQGAAEEGGGEQQATPMPSKMDNYRLALNKLQEEFPWKADMEPLDIERHFDTATLADVECYVHFTGQPVGDSAGMGPRARSVPPAPAAHRSSRAIGAAPTRYNDSINILSRRPSELGPGPAQILEALTTAGSNDVFSLERLETLGDAFLKFSSSLYLFHHFPTFHEGQLTMLKGRIVSNRNLHQCGVRRGVAGRMKVERFAPRQDGTAPALCVPRNMQTLLTQAEVCPSVLFRLALSPEEVLSGQPTQASWDTLLAAIQHWAQDGTQVEGLDMFLGRVAIHDKAVADSVEALLGVYLLAGGTPTALRLLCWLGVLPQDEDICQLLSRQPPSPLLQGKTTREQIDFLLNDTLAQLEATIGYSFKDPSLLLQAMSHASCTRNQLTESYERLEFLGDAVLDLLVTCHLWEVGMAHSPGDLTDMRSALVNNATLGGLVVRLGLHSYLQSSNVLLDAAVAHFVQLQQDRGHVIDDSVLFLLQEKDCQLAEQVEVPKVLGDMLEAVVGAIFLDSEGDLAAVWRVVYALMHNEIALFNSKVPKNPLRLLFENIHAAPQFLESEVIGNRQVMVGLQVRVAGAPLLVHGFGTNTANARRAAAKIALRLMGQASS